MREHPALRLRGQRFHVVAHDDTPVDRFWTADSLLLAADQAKACAKVGPWPPPGSAGRRATSGGDGVQGGDRCSGLSTRTAGAVEPDG
ncbi:hypothetical protein [Streptomyces sp. NPDC052107]|uniref:hypothetical protein n=1 Tax=Streptomyces sp. NPDC052107 TaxID=3155632 RepID=UPI0034466930